MSRSKVALRCGCSCCPQSGNASWQASGLEPLRGCRALWLLSGYNNLLTGSLEPLHNCTALQDLDLAQNLFTGGLESLRGCTAL